ncbi:MAG: hypothetical protein ABI434_15135 [Burkholderiaceae bacterium]
MIMFIRHGEKPRKDGSTPLGVTPDGAPDIHSLTVRGWIRAGALTRFFGSAHDGIETPNVIFAASAGDDASPHGRRPSQTVTPLSLAHGIRLDTRFAVGSERVVAAEILRQDGAVLVCWEHHNISLIVAALGIDNEATTNWPDDRFDLIWLFQSPEPRPYSFTLMNQALLDGDASV